MAFNCARRQGVAEGEMPPREVQARLFLPAAGGQRYLASHVFGLSPWRLAHDRLAVHGHAILMNRVLSIRRASPGPANCALYRIEVGTS